MRDHPDRPRRPGRAIPLRGDDPGPWHRWRDQCQARMLAAGISKPKAPKLAECVKHFFGEDLAGAHDALVDVRACARVFFRLRDLQKKAA